MPGRTEADRCREMLEAGKVSPGGQRIEKLTEAKDAEEKNSRRNGLEQAGNWLRKGVIQYGENEDI